MNGNKESTRDFVLISGSSHCDMARQVALHLQVDLGKIQLELFPDGEISVQILESVRGRDVFVIQSIAVKPNYYLMELLILVDALKRASARSIVAVIPYFGYCRQDRKDKPRVPITAKLVANLLEQAGVTRVLTVDLHAGQLQGFFDIPVDNLTAMPLLLEALRKQGWRGGVVVAPDAGSLKLARSYAGRLGVDFAVIDKHRSSATEVEAVTLIGDVAGKDVLLADDICSTGGTLLSAAKACREKGAKRIFVAVTHGLFVGKSVEKFETSPIDLVLMSNTVPATERLAASSKIQVVPTDSLIAKGIHCIISAESIHSLFPSCESESAPALA